MHYFYKNQREQIDEKYLMSLIRKDFHRKSQKDQMRIFYTALYYLSNKEVSYWNLMGLSAESAVTNVIRNYLDTHDTEELIRADENLILSKLY